VTINPPSRVGGAQNYGNAFLPAIYQGSRIGSIGQSLKDVKVGNLENKRLSEEQQRKQLDFIQSMNADFKNGKQNLHFVCNLPCPKLWDSRGKSRQPLILTVLEMVRRMDLVDSA
jgi:hypothetical protein